MHFYNLTKEEKDRAEKFLVGNWRVSNSNLQRFSPNLETWGVITAEKYPVNLPQIPHDTEKQGAGTGHYAPGPLIRALPFPFLTLSQNLLNYYWEVQVRLRHKARITLHGYTASGEASTELKQSSLKSMDITLLSLESINVIPPLP